MDDTQAKLGPMDPPEGHQLWALWTVPDKEQLENRSQCSVSYRYREQWGKKQVTVVGPPENLRFAFVDAMATLRARFAGTPGGGIAGGFPPQPLAPPQQPHGGDS